MHAVVLWRRFVVPCAIVCSCLAASLSLLPAAEESTKEPESAEDLAKRPITTTPGELGDLLRQWQKEGTAAGNVGDWYDNRDRGHSDLRMEPYPQLSRVVYTEQELKQRVDWAAARGVRPNVTFGNSSTSASVTNGGSNPRHYYTSPRGLELLYEQYTKNNLYIYPEHRDHDPGHNGRGPQSDGGYGDLYPANTPYLIISQGSSGTDQPFMRALPHVLAAFRPEVKAKLVETGLLMPTVQMIFRSSNNHLASPEEYLSGKAHPTVFEGKWVDPLAMVRRAHAIKLDELPPLVKLRVIEEQELVSGTHFFDPMPNERFADTPSAVVRIFRGRDRVRELLVSAADSFDANDRKLEYTWVLLRGDADRVRIEPREDGREAKIGVAWQPRQPVSPGGIESTRVDIGVFAHNGAHYSAPAFLSFFFLDSEARTYDEQGRILEIGYGNGESVLDVKDWPWLMRLAGEDSARARLLPLTEAERKALVAAAPQYEELAAAEKSSREAQQAADKVWREAGDALRKAQAKQERLVKQKADGKEIADEELEKVKQDVETLKKEQAVANEKRQAALKELQTAQAALREFMQTKHEKLDGSLEAVAAGALEKLLDDTQLAGSQRDVILEAAGAAKAKSVLDAERKRLASLAMVAEEEIPDSPFTFTPLVSNKDGQPQWTEYERAMLRRTNQRILAELLYADALTGRFLPNYVDPRLSIPKTWRDVYHYSEKGRLLGWTRHAAEGRSEFNPSGELVLERDELGRCTKSRTVEYGVALASRAPLRFEPLTQKPGDTVLTYKYATDDDYLGRVVDRQTDSVPQD